MYVEWYIVVWVLLTLQCLCVLTQDVIFVEAADSGGERAEEEPRGGEPAPAGEYSANQSQQVLHGGGPECGMSLTTIHTARTNYFTCTHMYIRVHYACVLCMWIVLVHAYTMSCTCMTSDPTITFSTQSCLSSSVSICIYVERERERERERE